MPDSGTWPAWGARLAWTLVTLGVSWGIGHVLGAVVMSRVPRWLPEDKRVLAQSAVQIVRKRLPWLSLLVGVWISAGYWPLTAEGHLLVGRVVFVLGSVSVTLAAAAIASQSVDAYGAVDQYLIKHEFIKRLHARFDQEGIVIPFPIRTIARPRNSGHLFDLKINEVK